MTVRTDSRGGDDVPHLYVAGAASGSARGGAGSFVWCAVLRGERIASGTGTIDPPTNQRRAEIRAVVMTLRWLRRVSFITDTKLTCPMLYASSNYVVSALNQWLRRWVARGWRRKRGRLADADLWKLVWPLWVRQWPRAERLPRDTTDEHARWCREMAQAGADEAADIERIKAGPYSRRHRRRRQRADADLTQRTERSFT